MEAQAVAPAEHQDGVLDKSAQEYASLLEKGKGRDFSEFENLHVLDITGHDPVGRPVVVFVASRLPAKSLNMDDFLLFIIQKLDNVVKSDYVLVYVGSEVSSANRPSVAWLRKAYGLFNRNYKKHIQKLYLIHPTTFTRIALKFFKVLVSEKFWRKLVQVDDVSQMHLYISPEQLRLPEACYSVPLRKGQKTVLFGVSLERALAENPHPSGIPAPFVEVFAFLSREEVLQTEGLFRVSGSESVMRALRQQLEAGAKVDWAKEGADVHSATGVLKHFIRELRVPVLPPSVFDELSASTAVADDSEYVAQTGKILRGLPDAHRVFALYLFRLCDLVVKHAASNKMSAQNVAVVLAPHLMANPNATPATALRDTSTQTIITRRIIHLWKQIEPLAQKDLN